MDNVTNNCVNGARTVFSVTPDRRRSHCRIAELVVEADHSPSSVRVSTIYAGAASWDTMSRVRSSMTYDRHMTVITVHVP